jgi:hypothetical protein
MTALDPEGKPLPMLEEMWGKLVHMKWEGRSVTSVDGPDPRGIVCYNLCLALSKMAIRRLPANPQPAGPEARKIMNRRKILHTTITRMERFGPGDGLNYGMLREALYRARQVGMTDDEVRAICLLSIG